MCDIHRRWHVCAHVITYRSTSFLHLFIFALRVFLGINVKSSKATAFWVRKQIIKMLLCSCRKVFDGVAVACAGCEEGVPLAFPTHVVDFVFSSFFST